MRDSWLDDALRSGRRATASPGFSDRVLARIRERSERRKAWFRLTVLSTSAIAAAAAVVLLVFAPAERPAVTADELAALRAELSSLRAALPERDVAFEGSNSGELQVDMEALLSASAGWNGNDRDLDTLFAVEGGQL